MPDGSTITVESDDMDGWSELKDWYSENFEVEEEPTLVFPINIAYETEGGDSLVVVESEEELMMSKDEEHVGKTKKTIGIKMGNGIRIVMKNAIPLFIQ